MSVCRDTFNRNHADLQQSPHPSSFTPGSCSCAAPRWYKNEAWRLASQIHWAWLLRACGVHRQEADKWRHQFSFLFFCMWRWKNIELYSKKKSLQGSKSVAFMCQLPLFIAKQKSLVHTFSYTCLSWQSTWTPNYSFGTGTHTPISYSHSTSRIARGGGRLFCSSLPQRLISGR